MARTLTLSFSCPDTSGIVAEVSSFVAGHKGWITEASQHTENELGRFFMRVEIRAESLDFPAEEFAARFAPVAKKFAMDWKVSDSDQPRRVVLLCSKQEHCLYDLLARHVAQDFPFVVPCVISNHENHRKVVEAHGIPFHYVPVTPETKQAAYRKMEQLFREAKADLIVLARYMQVLDEQMCRDFAGRIINIHHSFLPSFAGAKPYHQAHRRGVKLIGATCHFVTPELDEGPIVEQDVIRIDHSDTPEDMAHLGKDIEKVVLARGLRAVVEDRVLLAGNKTVIFR
ncbi:MAG: formyltetrahydrofolate deformylase [Verrucomicrobiota bacterium]|jgi:formyltetrahydrofolate deformylase